MKKDDTFMLENRELIYLRSSLPNGIGINAPVIIYATVRYMSCNTELLYAMKYRARFA